MTPTHAAALEYASQGWFVFPVEEPRPGDRESGKRPLSRLVPHGKDDATTDPMVINAWFAQCPNANIAIALDKSGIVNLDVDVGLDSKGQQKQGAKSLEEFDAHLAPTLTAITGGGGLHALYDAGGLPIHALALRPGIDIIGRGYIVAPPSRHYTGGTYRWNDVRPLAPVPEILRKAVASKQTAQVEKVQRVGTAIPEGGRNTAMFRLACALRDTGIGAEALARAMDAENKQRNNPPLDQSEMGAIVNSALLRVQVTRDVAIGAVLDQEVREALAPQSRSEWLENVAMQPQPPMICYSTGFDDLDKLLGGGFMTRQLTGIIGPPSAGKSALVGEWLLTLSKQRPVLHCSTELPRFELFVRYAAHRMGFPWRDGVKGKIPQPSMATAVHGTRIKLLGCDDLDRMDPIASIFAEAERMRQETGITPIIAIDYIQMLVRGTASTEMRHKTGDLTMRLREMSQALDTIVMGVFTTQRVSYAGKAADNLRAANDPTAYLGAAKESGDIEFDCATLMYLDVDKLHEGNPKPGRIAVARCRVGDVGFVGVRAQLDVGKFWGDASAAAEMSSEERKARMEGDRMQRACEALLKAIGTLPGRPWRELQAAVASVPGLNRTDADRAKEKLIADRTVESADRFDEYHRKQKGFTLVLRANTDSPTSVGSEEDV